MENNKTAIIIGAGPAGLTAAYELLKTTNIHPIIFEETDMIGGISQTVNYNGNHIDIGGHRFFTKNDEVMDLWKEIMPLQGSLASDDIILNRNIDLTPDGPDPEKQNVVMLTRHRVSRIYYLRKFFDYPISMKYQTFHNMGFRRTMRAGFGYLHCCVHKRKETNLENFYINRFGKPLYQMFFEKYTEKLWGRHPREIDASWGAQRVKGLSLSKTLKNALLKPFHKKQDNKKVETSLIESFYYPKYGPGWLYETLAQKIINMGGEIYKNSKVTHINIKDNIVTNVAVKENDSIKHYHADYVISSMPLKDLVNSFDKNVITDELYNIGNELPYRDFITVGLLIKDLAVHNKTKIATINNRIPDTWIYVQEEGVKLGRIQIFNNWSPYMVKDNLNTVWIGLEYFVNENDEYWNMKKEDFINFAIKEIESIGIVKKEDIIDSTEIKIKKAYPAYFDSYKDINKLIDYLNNITNLYCVGRNGQHHYNNMDHSMLCSINAVKMIQEPAKYKKEDLWKINTEKSYHEEK
jgi:protoporphyrinogen oxidase